eukprot:1000351-Pelagomonas_calceolata.AAC.4
MFPPYQDMDPEMEQIRQRRMQELMAKQGGGVSREIAQLQLEQGGMPISQEDQQDKEEQARGATAYAPFLDCALHFMHACLCVNAHLCKCSTGRQLESVKRHCCRGCLASRALEEQRRTMLKAVMSNEARERRKSTIGCEGGHTVSFLCYA